MSWAIIRKFAPFVAIALLIGVFLWQRNSLTDVHAKLDAKSAEAAQLAKANEANAKVIEGFSQQRIDNDAIATAVAAKVSGNATREVQTQTIIKEAVKNDPTVRAWADSPIPDGVRSAVNASR